MALTDIIADDKVRKQYDHLQALYPNFPVCMAKTQYSFSTDPALIGRAKWPRCWCS